MSSLANLVRKLPSKKASMPFAISQLTVLAMATLASSAATTIAIAGAVPSPGDSSPYVGPTVLDVRHAISPGGGFTAQDMSAPTVIGVLGNAA